MVEMGQSALKQTVSSLWFSSVHSCRKERRDKKLLYEIRGKKNLYFPYGNFSCVFFMNTERS